MPFDPMFQNKEVKKILASLIKFIKKSNYKGYDPYDLRGNNAFFLALQKNIFGKGLLILLNANLPVVARKLLCVRPSENSKTFALCLRAYCLLYKKTGDKELLHEATKIFSKLMKSRNKRYKAWGYPFDWQSKILIPKNTPSIVVTSFCGQGLLDFYEITNEKQALSAAVDVAEFILHDLKRLQFGDRFCFSYTPIDDAFVHNANALGASFLARLYSITKKIRYLEAAERSIGFTISQQKKDGSFEYMADSQVKEEFIDGYHTGFVLEALYDFIKYSGEQKYIAPLKKGLDFYKKHLFYKKTIPLYRTTSPLPVDIHAVAQALVVLSRLESVEKNEDYIKNIYDFAIKEMHDGHGYFYYWLNRCKALDGLIFKDKRLQLLNTLSLPKKLRVPYMRWSQAWMLWALANIVKTS